MCSFVLKISTTIGVWHGEERMYQIGLDMAMAEYATRKAIEELSAERHTFTHQDLADLIGCNRTTVVKACNRLIEAGIVRRVRGTTRNGYRYIVTPQSPRRKRCEETWHETQEKTQYQEKASVGGYA